MFGTIAKPVVLLTLICIAAASCGGGEESDNPSSDASSTDTLRAARESAELPSSLGIVEYNRLRDALDNDEVPQRVVPRLEPEERLSFSDEEDAREEFIDAIANADFQQADRVFASVPSGWRNELLNDANDAAGDTYSSGDYAEAYRFDRYLNLDNRAFWALDGDYISGRVTARGTGAPVPGASVSTDGMYPQTAQTDANGEFRLLIAQSATAGLIVEHPDYDMLRIWQTATGSAISLSALQGESVDIELGTGFPRLTFRGQLVDANSGEPLAGMLIGAAFEPIEGAIELNLQQAMGKFSRQTDETGRFEIEDLPVQTVQLLAQGTHGGAVYHLEQADFTFEEGVEHVVQVGSREVRLELPMVIVGTVKDRTSGAPIANARVSAGGWKAERTDVNGRFMMQLDTGEDWELTASHDAYHQSQPQPFASAKPQTIETEFLIDPITTGTILGTAINSITGEPIANAVIEIAGQKVRTDSRGQFRAEKIESGEVTVSGAQSGFRADSQALLLEALQTAEATLQLEPITTGTISGIVVEEGGDMPLAGVAVRAGDKQVVTGDDGLFVLEEVEAGALVVAATKSLYVPGSSDVVLEAMGSVETRIDLAPITWGTVRGRVSDATSGQPLTNATVRIGAVKITTDANGDYVAERVPAGNASIMAALARYHDAQATIELPRDGDIEQSIELSPITTGTVHALVINATTGEPIAGAEVMIGTQRDATDSAGQVTAEEIPAGNIVVNASARLYEPGSAEAVLDAAGESSLEIELVPITYGTVAGTVVDSTSGAPVADATISLAGRQLRSDAQGKFRAERVPAGSVSVSAELIRYRGDQDTVALERGTEQEVKLELEPITTGTVRGIVRNEADGQPISGAAITIGNLSARSDAAGRFEIEQVAAGETNARASLTLFEPGDSPVIVVAADSVDTEISLMPITYGTVHGTVVDTETGAPLEGATVNAGRQSTRTDAAGNFQIERINAGDVSIAASKPVYIDDSIAISLAAGASETVTLRLQAITWGTITGIIKDADTGQPLANAQINIGTQALRSDAGGRFRAEKVAAGSLQISGSVPAYQSAAVTTELEPNTERDVSLSLEPIRTGAINGAVLDAKTGEPIAQARVTTGRFAAETDAAGNFSFDDVNTGAAVVAARHPDYANGSASADVPPADAVDVVIRLDLRREDVTNLEAELAKTGTIDLYGIYFDSGKAQFKPSSLQTLKAVLEVMKRAPERRFRIAGHTDSDGGDDYNQDLSERRAKTVIQWLVDNGTDNGRLDGVGFGEARPAAPNDTESGKALNRRVQLSFSD